MNGTNPNDISCESGSASDFYGLGVRLGVYFTWWTAYVANTSVPSEISSALDTVCIFLLSLLVAMLRASKSSATYNPDAVDDVGEGVTNAAGTTFGLPILKQLDALVLLHLSAGGLLGVLSLWGYRTCFYVREGLTATSHFGGFGTHFRLVLATSFAIYNTWFWARGVLPRDEYGGGGGLYPVQKAGCDVLWTFWFARLPALGGIRWFYVACSACLTAYWGTLLLVSSISGWERARRLVRLARRRAWAGTSRLVYRTGFNERELAVLFRTLRVLNFVWLVFAMCAVEFILNFNRVEGVLGEQGRIYLPSQLLPMLIGTFSFVRIIWIRFEIWRSPNGDIEPSLPPTVPRTRDDHLPPEPMACLHDANPPSAAGPATAGRSTPFPAANPLFSGSDPDIPPPGRPRTVRNFADALRLFSPAMSRTFAESREREKQREVQRWVDLRRQEHDEREEAGKRGVPRWRRWLVGWMPWLSLLTWFRRRSLGDIDGETRAGRTKQGVVEIEQRGSEERQNETERDHRTQEA